MQTNYDRDKPDNEKDCRRNPAELFLEKIGEDKIKDTDLHNLLTRSPNHVGKDKKHEDEGTITTVMAMNGTGYELYWKMEIWDWWSSQSTTKTLNYHLEMN